MAQNSKYSKPWFLSARNLDVWRTLPDIQQEEIARYDNKFSQGWNEYRDMLAGLGFDMSTNDQIRLGRCLKPAIDAMVWQDFQLADRAGFPAPSPQRAVMIGRLAEPIGGILFNGEAGTTMDPCVETCAIALTGLHVSVLGRQDLIEAGQDTLRQAALELHTNAFDINNWITG